MGLPTGEALRVLMEALTNEAALNELGWFAFGAEAAHAIAIQRDFAVAALASTKSTSTGDVLVAGLPRTGTTLLHHLLALSDDVAAPRSWQMQFPTPRSRTEADQRGAIELSAARYELLTAIAPKVGQMHPLEADGIEECTPLLQHSLLCLQTVVMFRIPSFARWLYEQDMTPVYRFWNLQLNTVREVASVPRLALKSPLHFVGYDALLELNPPGLLVHVRRPIRAMLSSFLQLVESTRASFTTEPIDRATLATEWAEYLDLYIGRATRALEQRRTQVVSVDYQQLVQAPSSTLRSVCMQADLAAPSREAVDATAAQLLGKHDYERQPYSDRDLAAAVEVLAPYEDGAFFA